MSLVLIRKLLKISRPRFWIYLAGTFLLGVTYAIQSPSELLSPLLVGFFLWFTFPANLFVYGINDIYDHDTDILNPKKQTKEMVVHSEDYTVLKGWISIMISLGIILLSLSYTPSVASLFLVFLFLSCFYSATPIRAKAIPFLDTIFNSLYVVPGLIGYHLVTHTLPPFPIILSGVVWCMSMHAYSAIPDIFVDRTAQISTVATVLGKNGTLCYCFFFYSMCATMVVQYSIIVSILLCIYPLLMLVNILLSFTTLERFYWLFPWINLMMGTLIVLLRLSELI